MPYTVYAGSTFSLFILQLTFQAFLQALPFSKERFLRHLMTAARFIIPPTVPRAPRSRPQATQPRYGRPDKARLLDMSSLPANRGGPGVFSQE